MSDPIEQIAALADGEAGPLAPEALPAPSDGGVADGSPEASSKPQVRAAEPRALGYDVEEINRDYAFVLWGRNVVVVKERPTGPIGDRVRVLSIDAFERMFGDREQHTEVRMPGGRVRTLTWGRAWLTDPCRRQYMGVEFFPNPDGAEGTPDYLNLWRGFSVEPSTKGSYAIFRDHLLTNVCDGDQALFDWLFGWMAHMVQRPRERIGTAVVLRGKMGTGKTKVGEVLGSLFAPHHFSVDDPRYVTGNFNVHLAACLLLQVEEAVWGGDKHAEGRLKGLITSDVQMIEAKGIDAIQMRNFVRVMVTSNEGWVIPAGMGERRFCVFDVQPHSAQNHEYFGEMDAELDAGGRARLLYDLRHFDLARVNLRDIPKTGALLEQKMRSLDPLDSWWMHRLMEGSPTRAFTEWQRFVTIDALYGDYIKSAEEIGVGRKRDRMTFGARLTKLAGAIRHRAPRVEGESRRPWGYALPPLDECRERFSELLGQTVEWSTSDDEGSEVAPD